MDLDKKLLQKFELTLDTLHPDQGQIPIKILGYGEISLVFQLENEQKNIAYKRLPIFNSQKQVERHIKAFDLYQRELLEKKIGLHLLPYGSTYIQPKKDHITLFLAQEKIDPQSFCHKLIHKISDREIFLMFELLFRELMKVFDYNRNHKFKIGIDAQISNWAVKNYTNKPNMNITNETTFWYLDTSTPMFRLGPKEGMEAELFLKSAPPVLRTLLKYLFLREVLDRYYDFRLVIIDMIANLFKEQRKEVIPGCLQHINNLLLNEASDFGLKPIMKKEVIDYYKNDKQIWEIFQTARKFDRYMHTKLHKQYQFYLPATIQR